MTPKDWMLGVDTSTPNVARIYDYNIGGKNNFEADRIAADRMHEFSPYVRSSMRENRHFLRRTVTYLADPATHGIQQFLDLGAGLPTAGNVHEVAHQVNPATRVVYVDNDPIVLAHARALMAGDDKVRVVAGDARHPQEILADRVVGNFINWDEPLALMMIGLLHFVSDEYQPHRIVATLRDRMAPGSCLALSHGSADGFDAVLRPGRVEAVEGQYQQATEPLALRPRSAIEDLFDGYDLVDPGLVRVPAWRPDGIGEGLPPELCGTFGAVGRLRRVSSDASVP